MRFQAHILRPGVIYVCVSRFQQLGHQHVLLREQYRMTEGLSELSSKMTYDGLLDAPSTHLDQRPKAQRFIALVGTLFNLMVSVPRLFLAVRGATCETMTGGTRSKFNLGMASVTMNMFQCHTALSGSGYSWKTVLCYCARKWEYLCCREEVWRCNAAAGHVY